MNQAAKSYSRDLVARIVRDVSTEVDVWKSDAVELPSSDSRTGPKPLQTSDLFEIEFVVRPEEHAPRNRVVEGKNMKRVEKQRENVLPGDLVLVNQKEKNGY